MLYPLKFTPIYKEKIWGGQKLNTILNKDIPTDKKIGESWELSAVQDNISVVANGKLKDNTLQELIEIFMGDMVGEKVYQKFGIEFPLLIKFIDASDTLSVQVHPDDKIAKERHKAYGKNEIWYIIEAEKEAELILGFNQELDKNTFKEKLNKKELKDILHFQKIQKDEVYYIPAGRIHTIGEGTLLAEIQQTSDITYRVYDWDRTDSYGNSRELHIDLALDVIDYKKPTNLKSEYENKENISNKIKETPFFTVNKIPLNKKIDKDYNDIDSFVIYMILEGEIEIIDENNYSVKATKGETILIPAELKLITLNPSTKTNLLEIYI